MEGTLRGGGDGGRMGFVGTFSFGAVSRRRLATVCVVEDPRVGVASSRPAQGGNAESGKRWTEEKVLFVPAIGQSGASMKRIVRGLRNGEVVDWEKVRSEGSWEELMDAVLENRSGEKLTIVGESTGGTLAMMMALKGREEVDKLVLVNPVTKPRNELTEVASRIPKTFLNIIPGFDPVVRDRQDLMRSIGFSEAQLKDIAIPTTVVVAEDDLLHPSFSESERLINNIPRAIRCVLRSGGHRALSNGNVLLSKLIATSEDIFRNSNSLKVTELEEDVKEIDLEALEKTREQIKFIERMISPIVIGANRVPNLRPGERPILFVGNHTLYGVFDLPFFVRHFLDYRGILVRGMAHPMMFEPLSRGKNGEKRESFGAIRVSPKNLYDALSEKKWLFIFPGGIREAHKQKDDKKYDLLWPDKAEFVRTAAKFNAIVIPYANVGTEESFKILVDGEDYTSVPMIKNWMENSEINANARQWSDPNDKLLNNLLPPISQPQLPSRYYMKFGNPIDLSEVDYRDKTGCQEIYNEVRSSVGNLIQELDVIRNDDPYRELPRRLAFETATGVKAPSVWMWSVKGSYIPMEDLP